MYQVYRPTLKKGADPKFFFSKILSYFFTFPPYIFRCRHFFGRKWFCLQKSIKTKDFFKTIQGGAGHLGSPEQGKRAEILFEKRAISGTKQGHKNQM